MIGHLPSQNQKDLFTPLLSDFIDMKHELVLLADRIDWSSIEQELSGYYSHTGQKSMPIRVMVSFLILKRMYDLGDETLASSWKMNPYMQYFSGYAHFQHIFPCDPSDLVHFRHRIGEEGIEKLFSYSVKMHGKQVKTKFVLSDTTVQENNITFPTDAKLAKKVIDKCNAIVSHEDLPQRQSYVRVSKQLVRDTHNPHHPKRRKKAKNAQRKLKTIAHRLVRELERNLTKEQLALYQDQLALFKKVLTQQKLDKDKVYSLHKTFTACIAKGKAHKQYEFGNKIGLMVNPKNLIVLGVEAFQGNPHDSKTIAPLLNQMKKQLDFLPNEVIYDRGGKGVRQIGETKISTPNKPLKRDSAYQKRVKRKKFRRRAAIEPVIGHLKSEFRMAQNYLHGEQSPKMNALLAATGWNMKKMMQQLKAEMLWLYFNITSYNIYFMPLKIILSS